MQQQGCVVVARYGRSETHSEDEVTAVTVRGGQLAVSDSDSEARTDGTMGGGL